MPSTFFGIETARRALSVSQSVIETTGHNIANVNTPNYSRQRAEITEVLSELRELEAIVVARLQEKQSHGAAPGAGQEGDAS